MIKRYMTRDGQKVIIREAELSDAAQILEHTNAVINESTFMLTTPDEFVISEVQEKQWIKEHMESPRSLLLVAEMRGRIIGLVNFKGESRKRIAHLGTLGISVRKAARGMGIGQQLLYELIDWAEANQLIEKICLEVFANNHRAIHIYRKFGFEVEGRRIKHIRLGDGEYVDELLMYRFVNGRET